MDDKSKLAFSLAADFIKSLLAVSAVSLTFILTFFEKFITGASSFYLTGMFILALVLLLLSTMMALLSMKAMVDEVVDTPDKISPTIKSTRNKEKSTNVRASTFVFVHFFGSSRLWRKKGKIQRDFIWIIAER
jgi:Zn-dependent protease with chaperone function